ncbi:hypothetical protein CC53_gp055 [Rhizobium phage vB_RleS_L338C]|uniref:hypothetical protein n=1 Tax=Rhizobium phage vB_RleS_L338C TaxID=1414737 RepID=UPI0003D807EF|nr:hypothetical protein CC53_gp055 [Rhizobium phage vB_RleS_L338C]AHC30472.1 hypothetical protein L338C_055 [Rhizobium phage vB_RleS_L338C]QNH72047.1 hypothetical protein P11VFA_089 [Rhizobium phage P11VFA]
MQHVQVHAENGYVYVPANTPLSRKHVDQPVVSVALPTDKRLYTLKVKTFLHQQACRLLAPLLTAAQFTVFCQIFDRSIGWGRTQCFTTAINIAEGNGKDWHGCGVTERTVKRCVTILCEMGVISKTSTRNRGTLFTVNLEWKGDEPMLSIPKRLKGEQPAKQDRVSLIAPRKRDIVSQGIETENHSFPSVSHDETGYSPEAREPEEEKASPEESAGNSLARENIQALVERTNARIEKKREKNVERAKQKGNPLSLETIWRHAVAMHFPEIVVAPAWTKTQHGIIMAIAKKWTQGGKLADFAAFLEWCVVSWPAIMRQQFKWMTKQKPPMAPDFRFWAKFHEEFLNCYHSGKLSKWMRAAERSRLEFLKARGKTHEEALFIIAEEQAKEAMSRENRETLNAVRQTEQRIAQRQKMLREQEDRGARGVPVHPKSEEAKKASGVQPVAPIQEPSSDVDLDELEKMLADIPEWNEE